MKEFKLVSYDEKYLKDVVSLFIEKYQVLLKQQPLLPKKYGEFEEVSPKIEWITSNYPAWILLDDNQVIGYLTGIVIPNFKSSRKGVYIPEWGYGIKEDYLSLFNLLHEKLLHEWTNLGCSVFATTVLGHQKAFMESLVWNGYGMFVIDTIRDLQVINCDCDCEISLVTEEDREGLIEVLNEHNDYMRKEPTYLYFEDDDATVQVDEWLHEEKRLVFVAKKDQKVIGCMNVVIDGDDSCTIIRDHPILKITTTHVLEAYQGQGIAKALLNFACQWAKQNNYNALAVDFESANLKARQFWLKHFQPVCFSFIKYIDDRVIN